MLTYLEIACRSTIGLVFLVAAAGKLRRGTDVFATSVRSLPLVPGRYARAVAIGVVTAELGTPVLLAVPATVRLGFAWAGLLVGAFLVAILVALGRGVRADCACFGLRPVPFGRRHVLRNAILLGITVVGGLAAGSPGGYTTGAAMLAVTTGLVATVLIVSFDDVAELFVGPPRPAGR
jgi:hypothetical protein